MHQISTSFFRWKKWSKNNLCYVRLAYLKANDFVCSEPFMRSIVVRRTVSLSDVLPRLYRNHYGWEWFKRGAKLHLRAPFSGDNYERSRLCKSSESLSYPKINQGLAWEQCKFHCLRCKDSWEYRIMKLCLFNGKYVAETRAKRSYC